jgi:hypothetical protein
MNTGFKSKGKRKTKNLHKEKLQIVGLKKHANKLKIERKKKVSFTFTNNKISAGIIARGRMKNPKTNQNAKVKKKSSEKIKIKSKKRLNNYDEKNAETLKIYREILFV